MNNDSDEKRTLATNSISSSSKSLRLTIFCATTGISFVLVMFLSNPMARIVSFNHLNGILNKSMTPHVILSSPLTAPLNLISPNFPDLPIGIYRDVLNISLMSSPSKSKVIVLFNSFFGDPTWEIKTPIGNSSLVSRELNCPFLENFCEISNDRSRLKSADAVVFHMRDPINKREAEEQRQSSQRFVFALWESPAHSPDFTIYRNFFNWTFSYRFDSHILSTYFFQYSYIDRNSLYFKHIIKENISKSLNLKTSDFNFSQMTFERKRLGTAVALISNCGGSSQRLALIAELQKHIDVKVYGGCGERCSPKANCREVLSENYYFLLSFENSLCNDYTTEKLFATLSLPIVPVVYGRTNYTRFIPRSAYIDVRDFSTAKDLAQYLNVTKEDKVKYASFFDWKKDYVWGLNHFMTPFCDLCWRLHTDSKPNIIENVHDWWHDKQCTTPSSPAISLRFI